MGLGLDRLFGQGNTGNVTPGKQAATPTTAATASPKMGGDSLTISRAAGTPTPLDATTATLTPAKAAADRSLGTTLMATGFLGTLGAVMLSGPIISLTGLAFLPPVLGVGLAALALYGAYKFATGFGAQMQAKIKDSAQGIPGL